MSAYRLALMLIVVLSGIGTVQAQSLGEEVILSRLGDPVEVEIDVRDWQELDLTRVEVANATAEQYKAFSLVYQPLLDTLSFIVVGPNLAGEVKILVISSDPATEPFLDLLLTFRWPGGSALREYVLLFDPPEPGTQLSEAPVTQSAPALIVADPMPPVQVREPVPVTPTLPDAPPPTSRLEPESDLPRTVPEARRQPPAQVMVAPTSTLPGQTRSREEAGRVQYRMHDDDTLWTIARQFQPAGIADNLYQFVLSLHAINPNAFIDGNITLLKTDADLRIPSARDLAAINAASAQTVFDQRWLESVRAVQVQPEPEQAPFVSAVDETPLDEAVLPPAVETPEPELPDSLQEVALVAPSTVIVLASAAPAPATTQDEELFQANAALRQITDQATAIRDLLQARQQRLAAVEQQIQALRSQLQEVENHADDLVQALPQVTDITRQAVMLGLLAAVLLITLAATVMTALRWNRELQAKAVKTAVKSRRR